MLRFLRVNHLAVIDSVAVEFNPGLNVLTGETGAGKSILVEAVSLLLGERASGDLVRTGEESATIEAIFESGNEEVLVRREITSQGRSRAFVNGALSTATALRELSSRLLELHGQHEHQTLLDSATHIGVLDTFGDLGALTEATTSAFGALRTLRDELAAVKAAAHDRHARLEFVNFQLSELEKADLKAPDEDAELSALRQVLSSAERVKGLCAESYTSLYESDGAILATLGGVWRRVGELAAIEPQFRPYVEAREGIKSQLEDLAQFLRRYADGIEASPARLQQIEERLALFDRLKRKYAGTLAEVIAKRDVLKREASDLGSGEERVADLEKAVRMARAAYVSAAEKLSAERTRVGAEFAKAIEAELAELAMEGTRFEVRFADPLPEPVWTAQGIDAAEFYVSPNPGEDLRPLAKIVSGGELSRLMLAVKVLTFRTRVAEADGASGRVRGAGAPGMIFDEVDAGIGGRVADVIGRKLRTLGSAFQVLCITHLPQVAACADTHFAIDKQVDNGRTRATVTRLTTDARVAELARMLGGEEITDALRDSAREMLEAGRAKGERRKGEGAKSSTTEGTAPKDKPRRTP